MKASSAVIFVVSLFLAPPVWAESAEDAWTNAGIRSSVSATSESTNGGSVSSSVSSVVRSSGGETVVEVDVSAESDGECVEHHDLYEGGNIDVDIQKESGDGGASAEISVDVGDEVNSDADFSVDITDALRGDIEEYEEIIRKEISEERQSEQRGISKWWDGVRGWLEGLFR